MQLTLQTDTKEATIR